MKKLLATLLVAVMIMSCMSVVSFAAALDLSLGNFPYTDMATPDYDNFGGIVDPLGNWFFTNNGNAAFMAYRSVNGNTNNKWTAAHPGVNMIPANYNSNSPIRKALDAANDAASNYNMDYIPSMPTTVDAVNDGIIIVPIVVEGLSSVTAYIQYDADVVAPYTSALIKYDSTMPTWTLSDVGERGIKLNAATGTLGDRTGVLGGVVFVVKDSAATGNEDGTGSTQFSITFGEDGKCANRAETKGQIATSTMTVNLTGLTYDPSLGGGSTEPTLPEKVTEDLVADVAPVAAVKAKAASEYATEIAGMSVVAGDAEKDTYRAIADTDVFSCVFGAVPKATAMPEEMGLALVNSDGFVRYYPSINAVEGKFGVLVYGEQDILAQYDAYVYFKYNGEEAVLSGETIKLVD